MQKGPDRLQPGDFWLCRNGWEFSLKGIFFGRSCNGGGESGIWAAVDPGGAKADQLF